MEKEIRIVSNINSLDKTPNQILKFIILEQQKEICKMKESQSQMKELEKKVKKLENCIDEVDDLLLMTKANVSRCQLCQRFRNKYLGYFFFFFFLN